MNMNSLKIMIVRFLSLPCRLFRTMENVSKVFKLFYQFDYHYLYPRAKSIPYNSRSLHVVLLISIWILHVLFHDHRRWLKAYWFLIWKYTIEGQHWYSYFFFIKVSRQWIVESRFEWSYTCRIDMSIVLKAGSSLHLK